MALARLLPVLWAVCPVSAWITLTQARFGVRAEKIYNESIGIGVADPQATLGYLWAQPGLAREDRGLGSSITWAWDENLCDLIVPRFEEHFWAIPLVSCASVKASVHRAFDTWAMNSRFLKFTDVSERCIAEGYTGEPTCPFAEIWVTPLNRSRMPALDSDPIVSKPIAVFTTDFRGTNGKVPTRTWVTNSTTIITGNTTTTLIETDSETRRVIETVGGIISLRTGKGKVCWYLDSGFCRPFHTWKHAWNSPSAAYAVGVTILFTLWLLIVLVVAIATGIIARRGVIKQKGVQLDDIGFSMTDDEKKERKPLMERICIVIVSEYSVTFMSLRVLLLILPWPFFTAMFSTCWGCYDFEAAVAHEVGHLLGFGHPDLAPWEHLPEYPAEGANVYHAGLAAGAPLTNTSYDCLSPWAAVTNGVPEGVAVDSWTKLRPSIMEAFTRHNPRSCLTSDDLEGLNVMYPDCSGVALEPICTKPSLNLGWLRMCLYLVVPFFIAVLASALLQYMAARRLRVGTCGYVKEQDTSNGDDAVVGPPPPAQLTGRKTNSQVDGYDAAREASRSWRPTPARNAPQAVGRSVKKLREAPQAFGRSVRNMVKTFI